MLELKQNFGIGGEFQVVIRRADGSVRLDTGMQKNLILDNGLKYFLSQKQISSTGKDYEPDSSGSFLSGLVVGSGNQEPTNTETALQNYVAYTSTTRDTEWGKTEPTEDQHPNFVKVWKRTKFIFDNINNKNISELGLVRSEYSEYDDSKSEWGRAYLLLTRALIKGSDGRPLTVTVLEGEILEVIYQINMYVDTRRQTGEFKLTTYSVGQTPDTGAGEESKFDYFLQPLDIATGQYIDNILSFTDSYYRTLNTYGVKESDEELNADYDLNQLGFQADHKNTDWTEFDKLHSGKLSAIYNNANKYADNYKEVIHVSTDILTGTQTAKIKVGIYSAIHDNGIRSFLFDVGYGSYYGLVSGWVVLKNKANGRGIKKTNRQIWEFLVSYTIKRWEG